MKISVLAKLRPAWDGPIKISSVNFMLFFVGPGLWVKADCTECGLYVKKFPKS